MQCRGYKYYQWKGPDQPDGAHSSENKLMEMADVAERTPLSCLVF